MIQLGPIHTRGMWILRAHFFCAFKMRSTFLAPLMSEACSFRRASMIYMDF